MIVLVATMAWLTWWQASRALSGNTLSYVYAFEWPLLAGVVVYMWWDLLHEKPRPAGERQQASGGAGTTSNGATSNGASANGASASAGANGASGGAPEPEQAVPRYRDDEDEELAAYNRYLAELNASGRRKTWRHPT
jgi:hypothetical protein